MKNINLHGEWTANVEGFSPKTVNLPGTLDEFGIGVPDKVSKQWHPDVAIGNAAELINEEKILTRLTRAYTYEGAAYFSRIIKLDDVGTQRIFLDVERSRELSLKINGRNVITTTPRTLSTPTAYEITKAVQKGDNEIILCCDNSYPNFPRTSIINSSAATDETQTNWNGILGCLQLRYERRNFISAVRIYPIKNTANIEIDFDCMDEKPCVLTLYCDAFSEKHMTVVCTHDIGKTTLCLPSVKLSRTAARWDEGTGVLHELTIMAPEFDPVSASFGIRDFSSKNGRLALNNRVIFLRCETNCAVFPKTGYAPMDVPSWVTILKTYAAYGVNCVRFHSYCPPRAAFIAADQLGMMLAPELSQWNVINALEDDDAWTYYQAELRLLLNTYANHPSFVMLTLGNELHSGALGYKRMQQLVRYAQEKDPTRLHAIGSNNFIGATGADYVSDFYTASAFYDIPLRGTSSMMTGYINESFPILHKTYNNELRHIREECDKPVFSFEVGQYAVLPDFEEWTHHDGVTIPDNYMHIKEKVAKHGFADDWAMRVAASGMLANIAYREEIEAVLRTEGLSGTSLLALQDFPGQGTALIGMLNAHLEPKPYAFASPERFKRFFNDVVLLARFNKYTYRNAEALNIEIQLANYGKKSIKEPLRLRLMHKNNKLHELTLPEGNYPCGKLNDVYRYRFALNDITAAAQLDLTLWLGNTCNSYSLWVYPDAPLTVPNNVTIASTVQDAITALHAGQQDAITALHAGQHVLLSPEATETHFPHSIKTHFTTDFWSVGTFPEQSGFMGLMMDDTHPLFKDFPTEFHSNWQWWHMCQGRAVILPYGEQPLITALDAYARMRNMGMLMEYRIGNAKLIISGMGLMEKQSQPEVRALTQSIVNYMGSSDFEPRCDITEEQLKLMVQD